MLKIHSFTSEGVIDGQLHGRAEISVGSTADLDTTDGNVVFTDGSIAWDISTGAFYGLTGGTWYAQDGTGAAV